jgi:hypothetical protein
MREHITIDDFRLASRRQLRQFTVNFALMMLVFCAALYVIARDFLLG